MIWQIKKWLKNSKNPVMMISLNNIKHLVLFLCMNIIYVFYDSNCYIFDFRDRQKRTRKRIKFSCSLINIYMNKLFDRNMSFYLVSISK